MDFSAVYLSPPEINKPSIFELIASENLSNGIYAAFKHLCKVIELQYPRNVVLSYSDEIYLIIDTLLQAYYLKNYGGSLSEVFYGLRRINHQSSGKLIKKLSSFQSLLIIALEKYISGKLKSYYQYIYYLQFESNLSFQNGWKESLQFLFLKLFPHFYTVLRLSNFLLKLGYIFEKLPFHSLNLMASHAVLTVSSHEKLAQDLEASNSIFSKLKNIMSSSLHSSIFVLAFGLQFLEWYHSSDNDYKIERTWKKLPPPIKFIQNEKSKKVRSTYCPLCNEKRVKDTALKTSGFVFCFHCILNYLNENGVCPITKLPSTLDHLIKIHN